MKLLTLFACAFTLALAAAPVAAQKGPLDTVPEPFREAIRRETAAGLRLEAVRETETGGAHYLAAIFSHPESDKERPGFKALRVFSLAPGGKAEKRAAGDEEVIDFGTYDDPETVYADVNKDGTTELVVSAGNRGNCWNCLRVLLYTLDGERTRLVAAAPMTLKDLDGDGAHELLVGDTRWEFYDEFSHAGSPGGTLVYTWRDGRYVFAGASPVAASFYKTQAEALRAELPEAVRAIRGGTPFADEPYLQIALSRYLIAVYTGQTERGAAELRAALAENVADDEMRARRKRILEDFLSGESATKLAEPRQGAPLDLAPPVE